MIYVLGDSNTSIFSGTGEIQENFPFKSKNFSRYFEGFRLGHYLAYNIKNNIISIKNVLKTINFNKDLDILLFLFGEIDCREHLCHQSIMQNKPLTEIVKETTNIYGNTILEEFKNDYIKLGFWGIHPPFSLDEQNPNHNTQNISICVKLFNDYLFNFAKENNLLFLSIYNELLSNNKVNGYSKYYLDGIHLGIEAFSLVLNEFVEKKLIKE